MFFQRASDITSKVEEGSADLGIVGLDRFSELHHDGGSTDVIVENLPFGNCDLVLAVPEGWVDVAEWTVVIRPSSIPKWSCTTLARGARQLVVQLALDTTVCSDGLKLSWLTPMTIVGT